MQPKLAWLGYLPHGSWGGEGNFNRSDWLFTLFDAISNDSQRKSLWLRNRFVTAAAGLHYSGKLDDLRNSTPIRLLFRFNPTPHDPSLFLNLFIEVGTDGLPRRTS